MHISNTLLALALWVVAYVIVFTELNKEIDREAKVSYKILEETLSTAAAGAFFVAFRIAHGFTSFSAVFGQLRNPLMLRSSISQCIFVMYFLASTFAIYCMLLNHADFDYNPDQEAKYALQWIALVLMISNCVFAIEQFSHPELIYCCDARGSELRRKCGPEGERIRGNAVEMDDQEIEDAEESLISVNLNEYD